MLSILPALSRHRITSSYSLDLDKALDAPPKKRFLLLIRQQNKRRRLYKKATIEIKLHQQAIESVAMTKEYQESFTTA